MSPQRNREETISVDVVFSSFAGGGPEVQQTVTERAYALCALLETTYRPPTTRCPVPRGLRVSPAPTSTSQTTPNCLRSGGCPNSPQPFT